MSRLQLAVGQLRLSRGYLLHLLSNVSDDDWFRMPVGLATHLGWQVGHVAIAHYNLLLDRLRGYRPEDDALFPRTQYVEQFGRLSQPAEQTGQYPTPAEIRQTLATLHTQALSEVGLLREEELDEMNVSPKPHPIVTTKLSSILWCAQHEMLHAGQIGLVKRLLGAAPMW